MKGGKHLAKRTTFTSRSRRSSRKRYRLTMPALLTILLVVFAIGSTTAFLITHTDPVENKFTPANVSCEVNEVFEGNQKTSITVRNTGNIEAYVRIRFVTYRENEVGERIGGEAAISNTFSLNNDWVRYGDYFYCKLPVGPNDVSPDLLDSGYIGVTNYSDADGGKQVIEVIAEAIQSEPTSAVEEAWGVGIYSPQN